MKSLFVPTLHGNIDKAISEIYSVLIYRMVPYMKLVDIDFHKLTNIIYIYIYIYIIRIHYLFHILNVDIDQKYI